ncbi:hypothetical protein LTR53_000608 [Teratosphaeriaceae sp. CCFEE 6253]|nr:hypothetical protein LTR53_000608 [Teratosphaeriaceae sp. CCFEE 6253]
MLGRTVGIAAACALGAGALLIPPGVASSSDTSGLSVSIVDPKSRSVAIPCSGCAFVGTHAEPEPGLSFLEEGSLVLDFAVSEDGERLLLGGVDIYPPPSLPQQHAEKEIHVKQVPGDEVQADTAAGADISADLVVTAYGLIESDRVGLSPNGDVLVPVSVQIFALMGQHLALEGVDIKLLQTGTGELLIMDVTHRPLSAEESKDAGFPPPPPPGGPPSRFHGRPHGPPHDFRNKECLMLPEPLCKLRAMLDSKIDAAMGPPREHRRPGGCPGHRAHPDGPPPFHHWRPAMDRAGEHGPPNHPHGRPHHMRPHSAHHGHHRHGHFWGHHFLRGLIKGVLAILIPVMAGITVGMTVSFMGLVVGRLIGYLWIRLVRGGRRGSASVVLEEAVVEDDEEKPFLAEMEAPPVYEDAPVYVAAEKEQE